MGAWKPFHRSCSITAPSSDRPAPNPARFDIVSCEQHGSHYLSVIDYPDCTNFEGRKVIVSRVDPRTLSSFDPHFERGGNILARFEPTSDGIALATMFIKSL